MRKRDGLFYVRFHRALVEVAPFRPQINGLSSDRAADLSFQYRVQDSPRVNWSFGELAARGHETLENWECTPSYDYSRWFRNIDLTSLVTLRFKITLSPDSCCDVVSIWVTALEKKSLFQVVSLDLAKAGGPVQPLCSPSCFAYLGVLFFCFSEWREFRMKSLFTAMLFTEINSVKGRELTQDSHGGRLGFHCFKHRGFQLRFHSLGSRCAQRDLNNIPRRPVLSLLRVLESTIYKSASQSKKNAGGWVNNYKLQQIPINRA